MNNFLEKEEIQELTGFKNQSKQVKFLKENALELNAKGFDFFVNGLGKPIVFRTNDTKPKQKIKKEWEPKF